VRHSDRWLWSARLIPGRHGAFPWRVFLGCLASLALTGTWAVAAPLPAGVQFAPRASPDAAWGQVAGLRLAGEMISAGRLEQMLDTPTATWVTGGTPEEARGRVASVVTAAAHAARVPVVVPYNIPGRDCAQYSSGGAAGTASYSAWVDGVAAGIGDARVVVVLEPDSLGLLPSDCGGPTQQYPFTDADRYAQLRYAVAVFRALPGASVYLDGTNSAWLAVGRVAERLARADVHLVEGIYLNVANFERTEHQERYGTWISKCLAFASNPDEGGWRLGHYDWCASQYHPAIAGDPSTWHLTDSWYDANLGSAAPRTRMVIDTSRNGVGPWVPPAGHPAGDPETWCNPPERGAGVRPTADTGIALVDAYLWVKAPGESDGRCHRWTSGPADPVRGMVNPPAGAWFDEQALELAHRASPEFEVSPKPALAGAAPPPLTAPASPRAVARGLARTSFTVATGRRVRGSVRAVARVEMPSPGRYTLMFADRTTGMRIPMRRGSAVGRRVLFRSTSAAVVTTSRAGRRFVIRAYLPPARARGAARGAVVLRVVHRAPDGTLTGSTIR
jgi:endoglucanase